VSGATTADGRAIDDAMYEFLNRVLYGEQVATTTATTAAVPWVHDPNWITGVHIGLLEGTNQGNLWAPDALLTAAEDTGAQYLSWVFCTFWDEEGFRPLYDGAHAL
jgi:hypothetical protein